MIDQTPSPQRDAAERDLRRPSRQRHRPLHRGGHARVGLEILDCLPVDLRRVGQRVVQSQVMMLVADMRTMLLKALARAPRFKGRDRLSSRVSESFAPRPITIEGGLRMILDPYEWIQQAIIIHGYTEPATTKLIQRLLSAGDVFVDVGAHVGHHALVGAKAVGSGGTVVAIDPQPYNAERIGQNALLNNMSQIEVIPAAISDYDGFARFPFQLGRDRARFAIGGSPNDTSVTFECAVRRLDTVLESRGIQRVRLLKIDVEGFESQVLAGLGARLEVCEHVIFEQLPQDGGSAAQLLRDSGFEMMTVQGDPYSTSGLLPEGNIWARR